MISLNDLEELYIVLQEMRQEQLTLHNQIDDYQIRIKEADYYIKSISDKNDNNYKVFSPRNLSGINKEQIDKVRDEQLYFKKELALINEKYSRLSSQIERLQKILNGKNGFHMDSESCERGLCVLNLQEEDRRRIARDLHDTSLQNLTHIIHKVELSTMFIDQDPVRAKLELAGVKKSLKAVIDEIRNTIYNLRPMTFDDFGLKAAFERLITVINENMDYKIETDIDDVSCENNLIAVTIFRVVQECFLNIAKHANADRIYFGCKKIDNKFIIDIEDNGNGFSMEQTKDAEKHFGIFIMEERVNLLGGSIRMSSEIDSGTKVHIEVPV